MIVQPGIFSGLLDNLAGQFYRKKTAQCTGKDFAGQLIKSAESFFSISIVYTDLEGRDVFGVLCDDSQNQGAKNTYTFVIFISSKNIEGKALRVLFSLILAHEICHFAFYYELFLRLGGDASSNVYNKFKYTVSGTFEDVITPASSKKPFSQTAVDEHNVSELIYTFGKYPNEHFAKRNNTKINYRAFFFHFLEHLKFDKLLEALKQK